MSALELTTTAFIAGTTIVFGMAAMGVVESLAIPRLGDELGRLLGALGFALGVVFLIVGRTELFTENFFGPVAATIDDDGRWSALLRLWMVTLVLNLVGGAVLVAVLTIDGALPEGAHAALDQIRRRRQEPRTGDGGRTPGWAVPHDLHPHRAGERCAPAGRRRHVGDRPVADRLLVVLRTPPERRVPRRTRHPWGMATSIPLSILDLAIIGRGETATDAFHNSVELARRAEARGYRRIWYAEHHNMASIASSATSVLIAHVAAHTSTIRLGAGGVMLPNHSPLVIAEQFGTLATLHPGRIDLGLGRAPGSDQNTMRAMRRDVQSSDRFPEDVLELQGFLRGESKITGVTAVPGAGTDVPLYILGSSLFGARLAAMLGLPYAFASHFAPAALIDAIGLYRREFRPSEQLDEPYAIAGVNVIAADSDDEAQEQWTTVRRWRVARFVAPGRDLSDDEADGVLASPQGQQIAQMMHYSAVGTPDHVAAYLDEFARIAGADELITAHASPTIDQRLRSVDLVADAMDPVTV